MATKTLGTAATTTLVALQFNGSMVPADLASIASSIKDDQVASHPPIPGAFTQQGLLFVPNRGVLKLLPGDYVAYDPATGWPILLSALAAAGASYVHT